MPILSVSLFGKLSIQCEDKPVVFNGQRAQELFCYLLLHRERPHFREIIADTLWGDDERCQSKKIMRQAIWHLNSAADTLRETLEVPVLQIEPEWIRINPQLSIWLDTALFEKTFALCRGIEGNQLDPQTAQMLDTAVKLYQGDLLEGWYSDWCLYARERLQNIYLAMLDKLMDYCTGQEEYEAGIEYARRSLCYDRARECTHRRLMRLQYLSGDRTGALRQYECCVEALNKELGISPGRATCTLYQQIRVDQLNILYLTARSSDKLVDVVPVRLPKALDQLEQLQTALAHIQAQISEDIRAIEQLVYN